LPRDHGSLHSFPPRRSSDLSARASAPAAACCPGGQIGISIGAVVRVPLSEAERERGELLGSVLRAARCERSMVDVASEAGISVEDRKSTRLYSSHVKISYYV